MDNFFLKKNVLCENSKNSPQYILDMHCLIDCRLIFINQYIAKLYRTIQWQHIDKYKHKYDIYDIIIPSLIKYKELKLQFINSEFNKYIKYCDYAEEQCEIQEKILLYIMQMNLYSDELNIIVETLMIEPISKHICSISTDTIIILPQFEFEFK